MKVNWLGKTVHPSQVPSINQKYDRLLVFFIHLFSTDLYSVLYLFCSIVFLRSSLRNISAARDDEHTTLCLKVQAQSNLS